VKDENVIDEIKKEIINVIDHGQKKVLKQMMKPMCKMSTILTFSHSLDKEIQVNKFKKNPIKKNKIIL